MTEYKNPNYLALVREEYAQRVGEQGLRVSFIKSKKPITKDSTLEERRESFISDEDTPENWDNVLWIPLSLTDFPSVLSSMTANQAGYWAIKKCHQQNWDFLQGYESCLVNLEMDM